MEDIQKLLDQWKDPEYKIFAQKLLPGVSGLLGVRLPLLRRIAKRLVKQDWQEYLRQAGRDTFEEILLQGMVIGYAKGELGDILEAIHCFLPLIDNWSVCDSFCSGLKIARAYPEKMWEFLQPYFFSSREFTVRFAVVMSLFYFIDEKHLSSLFSLFNRIHHEGYYVKMAVAWAVSICYVQFPRQTMPYLLDNALDHTTYAKALQKITESRCVSQEDKAEIQKLRWAVKKQGPHSGM